MLCYIVRCSANQRNQLQSRFCLQPSEIVCDPVKSIASQCNALGSGEIYQNPVKYYAIQTNLLISSETLCDPVKSMVLQ